MPQTGYRRRQRDAWPMPAPFDVAKRVKSGMLSDSVARIDHARQ